MIDIHLYIEPPSKLNCDEKVMLCTGYIHGSEEIKLVELCVNNQVVGSGTLVSHYNRGSQKNPKNGFLIKAVVNGILANDSLEYHLKITSESSISSFPIGNSEVVHEIQKVNTIQENAVAICMPIFNPDLDRFKKQLDSLLKQTHKDFHIIIQDDVSDSNILIDVDKYVESIPKVTLFKNTENLGFYNNIELLLNRVGGSFRYICYSDQDDIWDHEKLEKQIAYLENTRADMVYSDLRILDEQLNIISPTFWHKRSNHLNSFHALALNNVATGSTMLFRESSLSYILPFPQSISKTYHDHWTCAITNSKGKVAYLDEPLVDYVQHDFNVTGFSEFKRLSIFNRCLSFFSLINICRKISFNSSISNLDDFIVDNQKVYFMNLQKLKLLYMKLDHLALSSINTKWTDLRILLRLLYLAIISPFKKYYFNRTEVALYTSIFVHYALMIRYLLRKNG